MEITIEQKNEEIAKMLGFTSKTTVIEQTIVLNWFNSNGQFLCFDLNFHSN